MRLTIGLPVYNARRFLAGTLRSIFAQTYPDWELVIVDDGSTDGSAEIARAVRDSRVSVLCDGENRGLSGRLNQIAELARGQYLARMDADDLMHPDRLARQVALLDAHREIDVLDTAIYSIDDDNAVRGVRGDVPLPVSPETSLCRCLLHHPAVIGRTEWFRRNHYDPLYWRGEDHELWFRTLPYSRFDRIPEPLLFYREGRIGLDNYRGTARTDRQLLRRFGPAVLGPWRTAFELARNWCRLAVVSGFTMAKADRFIIARRNRPVRPETAAAASEVLRRILRTPVPGLDDTSESRRAA